MQDIEKLNAIATMAIREYRRKNHRLKFFLLALVMLYVATVYYFLVFADTLADKYDVATALAPPLCIVMTQAKAVKRATCV